MTIVSSRFWRIGVPMVLACAGAAVGMPIKGSGSIRTITVAPSPGGGALPPPDPNIGQDLQYINQVYDQIGMTFTQTGNVQIIGQAAYTSAQLTNAGGLYSQGRVAGNIHLYYVNSYTGTPTAATSSWEDVSGLAAGQQNPGIVANPYTNNFNTGRMIDTMAHEMGHMLTDTWRWRNSEIGGSAIHSGYDLDVMCPSNTPRQIPANLGQVMPGGNKDQIRRNVGYYDNNAPAASQGKKLPLAYAMFQNNNQGLITINNADQIKVGIDNGAGLVDTGMYGWNAARAPGAGPQFLDMGGGRHVQVYEGAQRQPNNQERLSFHFYSDLAWGQDTPTFKVFDVDSVEANKMYTGYVPLSSIVEVSADFKADGKVMDGPGGNLVTQLALGTDYTISTAFSVNSGKLDSYFLNIIRPGALNGMMDLVVSFNMQVPTPGVGALLGLAGLFAARRRRIATV